MFGVKPSLNLKYPKKEGITKKMVERERKKMRYPAAWKISQDSKNIYMRANKRLLRREILKKQAQRTRGSSSVFTAIRDPLGGF